MKKVESLTPEEIESVGKEFGISYEPDISKCKICPEKCWWGSFGVVKGVLIGPHLNNLSNRDLLCWSPFKFVNKVVIPDIVMNASPNDFHGDIHPFVDGHTFFTDEELMNRIKEYELIRINQRV